MRSAILSELAAIGLLTVVLASGTILVPTPWIRVVLGVPFVLFFPGYSLLAALAPKKANLGGAGTIALSVAASMTLVSLLGFVLNYTPWGIRLVPIVLSLTGLILLCSIIALMRRARSPNEAVSGIQLRSIIASIRRARSPNEPDSGIQPHVPASLEDDGDTR